MGNRATVIFTDGKDSFSPAVYLHWNGGPESVYRFLEELDKRGVRADQDYECARFIELVGQFFDADGQSGLSLGVVNGPASDKPEDLDKVFTDHGDNGFYLVNRTVTPLAVRRFTEQSPEYHLVEWSGADVAAERIVADDCVEYRDNIRALFEGLRAHLDKVN